MKANSIYPIEESVHQSPPPPIMQQPDIQKIPIPTPDGHPLAPPSYDQVYQPPVTVQIQPSCSQAYQTPALAPATSVTTNVVHHHTGTFEFSRTQ